MYGALDALAAEPAAAMAAGGGGMVGVGMCPEGIEQNPAVYDLMSEWAFRCGRCPGAAAEGDQGFLGGVPQDTPEKVEKIQLRKHTCHGCVDGARPSWQHGPSQCWPHQAQEV